MAVRPHTISDGVNGEGRKMAVVMPVEEVHAAAGSSHIGDSFMSDQGVAEAQPEQGSFESTEITPSSDEVELELEVESGKPNVAPSPYAITARESRA